jgi:hypothetical protein
VVAIVTQGAPLSRRPWALEFNAFGVKNRRSPQAFRNYATSQFFDNDLGAQGFQKLPKRVCSKSIWSVVQNDLIAFAVAYFACKAFGRDPSETQRVFQSPLKFLDVPR